MEVLPGRDQPVRMGYVPAAKVDVVTNGDWKTASGCGNEKPSYCNGMPREDRLTRASEGL